ncbi:MAG: AAA family ATPase [SAR324 cluster bacterium]|nr:AAA family ATPase [SAR324 cluster bacterium]
MTLQSEEPASARPPAQPSLRLRVTEARLDDVEQGIVRVSKSTLDALGIRPGDVVLLEGDQQALARVWPLMPEDDRRNVIQMDGLTRENASVSVDGQVGVSVEVVPPALTLLLAPMERNTYGVDEVRRIREHLAGMALMKGNKVKIPLFSRKGTQFLVSLFEPEAVGAIAGPNTDIRIQEHPRISQPPDYTIKYEDIGGLEEELARIREMIELPMKYPEFFARLRIEPPKGVLLYGPPGTGKTTIARAVAGEVKAHFIRVNGPEIIHKFYGESEAKLREIFEEAQRKAPSIIFLDEIDAIAPKRSEVTGEVEKRVVAQLLALMDGMVSRGEVVVIGATNIPEVLDHALRRPGRFDREISVRVPNRIGRLQILRIHSRGMPLDDDVDLERLAEVTHGFVGADLEVLCKEAGMRALQDVLKREDFTEREISEWVEETSIQMRHFVDALKGIEPTAIREFFAERPNVRWKDVGGLEEPKRMLRAAVELPYLYPGLSKAAGTPSPKGVLLSGPPGTGKTMLVRALATETGFNFITVDAAALFSKWVGESEKALRQVFLRAKQASPCVLFFDEIDTIFPSRSAVQDYGGRDRLIGQFLSELDALGTLSEVVVVGATNRIELLERALLNPGRFGIVIELAPPSPEERLEILKIHAAALPLDPSTDLTQVLPLTDGFTGADLVTLCRRASFAKLQDFIAEHGEAAEAHAGAFRLCTEDFIESARTLGTKPGSSS